MKDEYFNPWAETSVGELCITDQFFFFFSLVVLIIVMGKVVRVAEK
jgi:hypothetical protein